MIRYFYLIINSNGTVRVNRKKPNLAYDEISMYIKLQLPDRLFTKPYLESTIIVPDDVIARPVITTEITDNIKEAIKEATNLDVNINLEAQPIPEEEN